MSTDAYVELPSAMAKESPQRQQPPNKNPRLNGSQSAHRTPDISSPNKANRKIPIQRNAPLSESDDEMGQPVTGEITPDTRYNPHTDPENASMHEQTNEEDVFSVRTQALGTTIHTRGDAEPGPTPTQTGEENGDEVGLRAQKTTLLTNSDEENPRPNTRILRSIARTPMPILTIVTVGTFEEEQNREVFGDGENPHGHIAEPEIIASEGMAKILRYCSPDEGQFIRDTFYPSYIFQGITEDRVTMYCAPENKFLALVFFNGGNALHTKYTKMVFELIDFLKKIDCKEDEIQVNAPFYQRPAIEPPHDNAKRGGRSRGGRSDKPSRKVIRGGVSPAGYSNDDDRYKGPNTAFILLESSNIRKRLMRLQTIAVSKTLTFHAFAPSTTQRPWTVCLLFATTTKTDTYIRAGIRWAIRKAIRDDHAILDKITEYSGTMGTAQQRAQHFINTIELYYAGYQATKEGQKCGVWVLYAAPFATGDTYTEIDLREQRV
ncbi:hypothetical protein DFJ43DRAFT_1162221 [Lentinula guzmanii]|uniref:Uncharacterized protein n=1 Tax=Lentinula guzmanii TaxID=2804957 RepID=A0AA38MTU0_9AGAR|nr:hypothetical protein DFJ43DRAFT_1162221 [Lentinula guzmanii]